jgi:hypothetical protein
MRQARAELAPAVAALEGLSPTPDLLRALEALRRLGEDPKLRPAWSLSAGGELVKVLGQLPQAEVVALRPQMAALHAEVRDAVLGDVTGSFATAPASVAGLQAVDQALAHGEAPAR